MITPLEKSNEDAYDSRGSTVLGCSIKATLFRALLRAKSPYPLGGPQESTIIDFRAARGDHGAK